MFVGRAVVTDPLEMRSWLASRGAPAKIFRDTIERIPHDQRDAWVDEVLGLDGLTDDGPELPAGCVPYLPTSVNTLLRVVDHAEVRASDVFVDVGSGVGRAMALVHFLTGAVSIGLEIQSGLARASRDLSERLNAPRVTVIEGDAIRLSEYLPGGTVFFLYCPFTGVALQKVLGSLESIASVRPIRVCCVHMPLLACSWLTPLSVPSEEIVVYRSER